jgi:predicted ATPase
MPDTIFGYYSGTNNRLEMLFDTHQEHYYRALITDTSEGDFKAASIEDRRLFYARPIHGVLALFALLRSDDHRVRDLLKDMVGITGFHSAMLLLRKPWFGKGNTRDAARKMWGATGRPGRAARLVRDHAFYPMHVTDRAKDDYRSKGRREERIALYLRNADAFSSFADRFPGELELFEELESIDISDLYRWVQLWVTRDDDASGAVGDVSYGELSEGERQLLMVLGLIWITRGKRTLFFLDEPDTHLNPKWQYEYLGLIKRWTGENEDLCHLIVTTHNPLMLGSLKRDEVRLLVEDDGKIVARAPEEDPIGIGVEGLLKSELFGLRSTLAPEILAKIDRHYTLLGFAHRTPNQDKEFRSLSFELSHLGITQRHPNPYFEAFATAMARRTGDTPVQLTPDEIVAQTALADELLKEVIEEEGEGSLEAAIESDASASPDFSGSA